MAAISQLCSRDSVITGCRQLWYKLVGISGKALPSLETPISSSLLRWRVPEFTLFIEAEDLGKPFVKPSTGKTGLEKLWSLLESSFSMLMVQHMNISCIWDVLKHAWARAAGQKLLCSSYFYVKPLSVSFPLRVGHHSHDKK